MTLHTLFPKAVRKELAAIEAELRAEDPSFDAAGQPFHLCALVLCWCVREIVKLREAQ